MKSKCSIFCQSLIKCSIFGEVVPRKRDADYNFFSSMGNTRKMLMMRS